ncbi:MAG: DUF4286 family protein [Bacteroidetes bacterium]|nr:DUF4286 family protein [Bacteroidota bacterium]
MYLYNVTINVENSIHDQWLVWMQTEHIPEVMQTGCFIENRILKVLNVEDEGTTYSIQYTFLSMSNINEYQEKYAKSLQQKTQQKFEGRLVAFRTLLQII